MSSVRWDNLSAPPDSEPPEGAAPAAPPLPLALPGAVTRTFDTPGFAGMTFHEVQAKSIINRVPGASQVPFEWTINPYRGCSHACSYCLAGDTPILMAEGRTKPLAELVKGDRVYGTLQDGAYRRYVPTEVLDHWSTVKPAYRVTLEDGTRLVASGDHRFLTDRGWKHVTGSMRGPDQRPHLTTSNRLVGTGMLAAAPAYSADYRRGYLCGVIRGAAESGSSFDPDPTADPDPDPFRLTLADREAMDRTRSYLDHGGVRTVEFGAGADGGPRPTLLMAQAARTEDAAAIAQIVQWPDDPTDAWRTGFLAGVFDAQGSSGGGTLRIAHRDDAVLRHTASALEHFGYDAVLEDRHLPSRRRTMRLRGGLRERLRFFISIDPAVTRKRTFDRAALKGRVRLRVTSIEALGLEMPLYDITTGTGDFIANGVVSHNCFARNTHTYLDLDAGQDFDSRVIVKVNAGELVRRELAAPKWRGAHIAMGTNVDCYQRAEGRYRLMPQIIAALRDFANPFSILTKGTLILRDLELLRQAASVTRVSLSFSVGFVDEAVWRSVESGTPSPRRRLDAVRTLTDAGFAVGVLMAPILPGLTDSDESIEETVAAISASGAVSVTPLALHLRPGAREWYAAWLAREHPALVPRYRELYHGGAYLPRSYQREVTARVRTAARRHGLHRAEAGEARQATEEIPRRPAAEQLTLL